MEDDDMKNNSIGIIVVGLIALLAIVVVGKWLLDNQRANAPVAVAPVYPSQPSQPSQPGVVLPPAYPHHFPQYHHCDEFWHGYRDGWRGLAPAPGCCPEYMQGYRIGKYDRGCGCPYYYDRYCPPGFSIRAPGFRLDIR